MVYSDFMANLQHLHIIYFALGTILGQGDGKKRLGSRESGDVFGVIVCR